MLSVSTNNSSQGLIALGIISLLNVNYFIIAASLLPRIYIELKIVKHLSKVLFTDLFKGSHFCNTFTERIRLIAN